jgi:hypothetical protein
MRGLLKDTTYIKKEDDRQQLKMGGGSWSINLADLPEEAHLIEYYTSSARYIISREKAFEYGFVKFLGGEEKLVVPLKQWQKVEI